MAKLAKQLRPASFRGVPFHVDVAPLTAGRRTQVHEYPQRDKPYVEDLGRAARDIRIEGFVVGENYIEQAKVLIGALEAFGPGTLIHPWLGTMQVSLKDPANVSFDSGLGIARVSMAFVEAGELDFPSAGVATQPASRLAAQALETAAVDRFASAFSVKGLQDFVAMAANGSLGNMLGIVSSSQLGQLLNLSNSLARTLSTAISFASSPASLGYSILGALGLSGLASSAAAWASVVRSLAAIPARLSPPAAPQAATPSRQQINSNATAVNALGRQLVLAQAVGASSLIGTSNDVPATSYQDMMTARDALVSAIDAEMLQADDAVFVALETARSAAWKDLTTRARDSARLLTYTPPETIPALVLSHDKYQTPLRDAEIIARNAIRHPGFVPAVQLKLLTK